MLDKFQQQIFDHLNLDPDALYVVAVSGGKDSSVLLDLLISLRFPVHIAHCNFGLRSSESDEDEAFVRNLAEGYGVPISVRNFKEEMSGQSANTQVAARDLRYAWFEELRLSLNATGVFVAHHQNDSVETNIYNFIKGTGPAGLSPMRFIQGHVIRPLLGFRREDIDGFAEGRELQWREDSSNRSLKYSRNKIRNQVIPLFKEINESVIETIGRNSVRHQDYAQVVRNLAEGLKRETKDGEFQVLKSELLKAGGAAVIFELFAAYGINWSQSLQVLGVLGSSGRKFSLKSATVFVEQEHLVLKISSELYESRIFNNVSEIKETELFDTEDIAFPQIQKTTQVASLDLAKVDWPLVWRPWEQGDFIKPLGMGGRKQLLSDVFINAKIGLSKKQQLYVLEMSGEVIWIPSIKFSESVKASASSRAIIQLAIRQ